MWALCQGLWCARLFPTDGWFLNGFAEAAKKGYFKAQLYLSLVYDEGNINIADFLTYLKETE